jgi:phage terminase large subunit-like protein
MREFEVFNRGKHDDQVDSGSCAFNELANEGIVQSVAVIW